jgi:hypothetical protein
VLYIISRSQRPINAAAKRQFSVFAHSNITFEGCHFKSLLPSAFSPNLSTPLELCCFGKLNNPTLPAFRSSLYLLSASRKCSAVNGPRLGSFRVSVSDNGGDGRPVCDSSETSSHCNCTLLASSIISPAKIFVTDLTAKMTLAGTDCESV